MADIESLLKEKRSFEPPAEFAKRAHWNKKTARELRKLGEKNPQRFWARMARENVSWFKPWRKVLDWRPPQAKWFVGAKLNVSYNCLDRHLEGESAWRRNKAAIIWEGEPGDVRTLTFGQLHADVCRAANALKELGIKKGDRVVLYMPMVPELAISMLACTRIGAVHSVVFGGFSAEALRDRILDVGAKLVVTADGGYRRGAPHALKPAVDEALKGAEGVERVLVVRRTGEPTAMQGGRDLWWHEVVPGQSAACKPASLDAEHPLFVLYTSGSTGKPKGILHTTGGYLTHVTTTAKAIFDLKDEDTYWCTADCGWITGHSYVVYGILANGATTLMYEGTPTHPGPDRFWDIIERHRVTVFYTAPTAIRTFIRLGDEHPKKHDLSSLRLLGSVGEPINPEAWMWYHRVIGRKKCPIVDTWWQTETGGIMISPLPGEVKTKPGSATRPFPGVAASIYDEEGRVVKPPDGGFLVLEKPWPGMLRGIWGDPKRFKGAVLVQLPRHLFRRRQCPSRPGRLLLDHGPHRRRDERVGPPHRHHGGGERVGLAPQGRRGRRDRSSRRDHGNGDRGLRDARRRNRGRRRAARIPAQAGHLPDRRHRQAQGDPLHRRPAQDPLGQDHAPPAAEHRRRRGAGGRHQHPRGLQRAGQAARGGGGLVVGPKDVVDT